MGEEDRVDQTSQSDLSIPSNPQKETADIRHQLTIYLKSRIEYVQLYYHDFLAELTYLQGGGLISEYDSWRRQTSQELMHALCSGHLDAEDLNKISSFMSSNIPIHEIFPVVATENDDIEDGSDEDIDGIVDESAIPLIVRKEADTLRRVLALKKLGLWSDDGQRLSDNKPSFSSLAPPPELTRPKDHSDYLFAELRWLAEDMKKERHWKRVSARKLAYAALKVYREKAERSQKSEKEEIARVRKQCSVIARMVRDWWRQMDKIVQTKQKARLTARHQQAMSTHLGHVIETTERYTVWLTEGITGSKQPIEPAAVDSDTDSTKKTPSHDDDKTTNVDTVDPEDTDVEFKADDSTDDDEETIAKEEEIARQELGAKVALETESVEVAALCAEVDASIDELLPPGYLEYLRRLEEGNGDCESDFSSSQSVGSRKTSPNRDDTPLHKDRIGKLKPDFTSADENSDDDETTLAEQEAHEKNHVSVDDNIEGGGGPSALEEKEVAALEAEADMSIDDLLAHYGLKSNELGSGNDVKREEEEEETSSSSESASGTSSSDNSDDDKEEEEENCDGEDFGLEELLSEDDREKFEAKKEQSTLSPTDNAALKAITAEALSAQPQGNTLASLTTTVKTPFLLTGTLREYQIVGLSWLAAIYEKRLNGILADEMGLGKTIQTIAMLAHLACELGIWGPHLIVVPTSVILNWEVEFKKWCPGFKILTYFGSAKERKAKRKGWTKTNAFHVCITSYRLAIQDSSAFKRKKWKYLILDEAQNIKNFKSQRWQTLLTFNSQRRLLLTGTPLQNSLMELWSLMHFLMPNIFQSHREFHEWFASPLTGMIEGNSEYNEQLVLRLHKVLRPFLLRRLKDDVERQMPKKYEHVILCRLSTRQRYLYDDFMSLSSTKDTLALGQFLSVMNILMQLRKVCNHPNLFEPRPITSPFRMGDDEVQFQVPRLLAESSQPFFQPFSTSADLGVNCCASAWRNPCTLDWLDRAGATSRLVGQTFNLAEMTRDLPGFVARQIFHLRAKPDLISVIDTSDALDSVCRQRNLFAELKLQGPDESHHHHHHRRLPPVFLPRSVVSEVNDEVAKSMSGYYPDRTKAAFPMLPRPNLKKSSYIPIEPPSNPWDAGIPKSIIRCRRTERKARLSLIASLNERRCTDPYNYSTTRFETSLPTADLVYFLTSCLRNCASKSTEKSRRCRRQRPFAVGAWVACQQAVRCWPDRRAISDTDGPPNYRRHPVDVLGGFDAVGLQQNAQKRLQSWYGPEASFVSRAVLPSAFREMLFTPVDCVHHFSMDLAKFLITTPAAVSSGVRLHTSSANVQRNLLRQESTLESLLHPFLRAAGVFQHCNAAAGKQGVQSRTTSSSFAGTPRGCACHSLSLKSWLMPAQLHQVYNSHAFQFPDPRLIQYDCGKLQRLDHLLRELYADDHRVLIFTQMARMLDILEQFLAYHGYSYVRLDGTTKVEQRQILMERFNMDSRIFVFILSTRSGGLGVNLTGADTVIFYDSDWNPTMDAQAQDRCHRIGQTRDVHIYRLISERTVEENILRKANQKRLLSDVAIEGGKFTTAFFGQSIITDLFAEPSGLQDLVQAKEQAVPPTNDEEEDVQQKTVDEPEDSSGNEAIEPPLLTTRSGRQIRWKGASSILVNAKTSSTPDTPSITDSQWEAALEACEDDENDRVAAKRALDEAKAELDEFDETVGAMAKKGADGEDNKESTLEGSSSDPLARIARQRQLKTKHRPMFPPAPPTLRADPCPPVNDAGEAGEQPEELLTPEAMVERELAEFEALLKPIELFGVNHLESFQDDTLNLELEQVEAKIAESKKEWKLNKLKALHEADEERAELEEDEILYCDPDYDPEAARLAELDEMERAEESGDFCVVGGGFRGRGAGAGRGRRGRGVSGFRGRGPRIRGGAASGGMSRVSSDRSIRGRDSNAATTTNSNRLIHGNRFRRTQETSLDSAVTDKAAWFHARYRDSVNGARRRAAAPLYRDLDELDDDKGTEKDEEGSEFMDNDFEDDPEETDIWSPTVKRTATPSSGSPRRGGGGCPPPVKRPRGRGRGRGRLALNTGKRRPDAEDDFWLSRQCLGESRVSKRGRRHVVVHPSMYEVGDDSDTDADRGMVCRLPPAGAYSRVKTAQRHLDFGSGGVTGDRMATSNMLDVVNRRQISAMRHMATQAAASATPVDYPSAHRTTATPHSSYISAFSGPLGGPASASSASAPSNRRLQTMPCAPSSAPLYREQQQQQHSRDTGGAMLQHNSKLLNSLMQAAPGTQRRRPGRPSNAQLALQRQQAEGYPQPSSRKNSNHPPGVVISSPSSSAYHQSSSTPAFLPAASNYLSLKQPQPPASPVVMRSANIAPPCQYRPPMPVAMATEPLVQVQALSNGVRGVRPIRQVLGSTGQPVFVITRQMKTPSGEVYQQRITQPVQPPTQFVQVVRRINQGPTDLQPRGVFVGHAVPPSARPRFAAVAPTLRLPLVRLGQPASPAVVTSPLIRVLNAQSTANQSASGIAGSSGGGTRVIRVVRSNAPNAIHILQPRVPP